VGPDKRYSVFKIKATHMADIELDNIGEDRTDQREETERAVEEETSFNENTAKTEDDYNKA
jgi:hypothetical protein